MDEQSPEPQNEYQRDLLHRYPALAAGSIRLGGPNRPEIYERMPPALEGITSAELLDQDRGER